MNQAHNRDRTVVIVCIIIFLASAVVAVLPFVTGMDMMQTGYGLSCLAGFFALTALIAALVSGTRAAAWDKLARGQDILAHWTYSEQEWQAYSQIEFEEESVEKRNLWLVVAGIALLVGIIFFIADPQGGRVVLFVMLGLPLVTGALAFGMP